MQLGTCEKKIKNKRTHLLYIHNISINNNNKCTRCYDSIYRTIHKLNNSIKPL